MLAAKLHAPGELRVEETEIPTISENEILLQVKSAAICGTDLRLYRYGNPVITKKTPRILGHEFSGVITKAGRNVKGCKEGEAVTVAPNIGCGICNQCVRGNTHLCPDYRALGIHLDGGFAEYVRIPEAAIRQGNVSKLPPGVSFVEAALNEPLSCVYNGFLQYKVKPGDTVLIIGAGPIGVMHAKLANMAGAAKVILTDLLEERLALSRQVESKVITVNNKELREKIEKLTYGHGVDVCITACPSPQAQKEALELTAMGGRVNFFGGLPAGKELVTLNTNLIHYKQLVVTGSTRASLSSFRQTLKFIAEDLVDIKGLVSNQYPLTRINEAFQAAEQGRGLKNVIVFEN